MQPCYHVNVYVFFCMCQCVFCCHFCRFSFLSLIFLCDLQFSLLRVWITCVWNFADFNSEKWICKIPLQNFNVTFSSSSVYSYSYLLNLYFFVFLWYPHFHSARFTEYLVYFQSSFKYLYMWKRLYVALYEWMNDWLNKWINE